MPHLVRIDNWSVVMDRGRVRLKGNAHNHPSPEIQEGEVVITSEIVSAEGNQVLCESRLYELGTVKPDFERKCAEKGIALDRQNPAPCVMAMKAQLESKR